MLKVKLHPRRDVHNNGMGLFINGEQSDAVYHACGACMHACLELVLGNQSRGEEKRKPLAHAMSYKNRLAKRAVHKYHLQAALMSSPLKTLVNSDSIHPDMNIIT